MVDTTLRWCAWGANGWSRCNAAHAAAAFIDGRRVFLGTLEELEGLTT